MGTMKIGLGWMIATVFGCAIPAIAQAQHIVAFYAPSLDFQDGGARNQFVSQVAKALTDSTGVPWTGKAYARASDYEEVRDTVDVAILDADYFSAKSHAMQPVASLTADGKTKRPLKIIARKGAPDKLYLHRNHSFAITSGAPYDKAFITSSALGHEISASDYFSALDEVRDVRSALNAVEMGKADLAMAFDGYDSGFVTIYTTPAVGLPVIAINETRLADLNLDKVKHTLQHLSAKSSFINGSAAYDAASATAYQKIAKSGKPDPMPYQPADPESTKSKTPSVSLPAGNSGVTFNPGVVDFSPSLPSLDDKLDRRL